MGKLFKGKIDPTQERELRVAPIAKEIIQLVAAANLPVGDLKNINVKETYDVVAKQVIELLLKRELKYIDKEFLFQLVLQPASIIQETVLISLKESLNRAHDKSLGVVYDQATLADLDRILKAE